MTYKCFKLRFPAGLHISSGGFGDESADSTIHSDTLFSAICSAARLLYGAESAGEFLRSGNVRLSTAFPFYDNELFFPMPLTFRPSFINDLPYPDQKLFKKVKFVCHTYFEKILNGDELTSAELKKEQIIQNCWSAYNRTGNNLFKAYELPRVTIDRVSASSNIFNFSEIHFSENAGLFFMAEFANDISKNYFSSALHLLGDEGIGADRTVGKGLFGVEESSVSINTPESNGKFLLMSLFSPTEEEIDILDIEKSSYELIQRKGWISAPEAATLRRKSLRMFAERSVLTFENGKKPEGELKVVLDNEGSSLGHQILRNGQPFCLPIS